MKELKPLAEQTIVLTGASSGIGLVTARKAAANGARLVLASRNSDALTRLTDELKRNGADALAVRADVGVEADVQGIADEAVTAFGGFDSWINNAGVTIYGNILDVTDEDNRRLFDTNFWGVVYGSVIAARHMRLNGGGAIVNVGSVLSDRAVPVQGMYSASKHAVKGFTDALRMELEAAKAPISVTLVKPSAIDTPYTEHARNYMTVEPRVPPPVYAPEIVADAILHCCENTVRDMVVGGGGRMLSTFGALAPRVTDLVMESAMVDLQKKNESARGVDERPEGLHSSRDSRLKERGDHDGHVMESSLYTKAAMHPYLAGSALALGLGGLMFALSRAGKNGRAGELGQ